MLSFISTAVIDGSLCKVETVSYSNGSQVKRIFSKENRVPVDIIWVKQPVIVDLWDVIEHREVQLYKHYFKAKH